MDGTLLDWFRDYLSDRYQRVVIRGQESVLGLIRAGVPQGSVLGPLLFLIYINDITNITESNIKLFADDTCLYIEADNPIDTAATINSDLESISGWADQWLVTFSPAKTKLMTCSFKNLVHHPIFFANKELTDVVSHKHLGLTLSNNLSWSVHIRNLLDSVKAMSNVLKRLKYDIDRKSIETIYFSFIRPKLEYACHVWDNCSIRDSKLLDNYQLEIARVLTGV